MFYTSKLFILLFDMVKMFDFDPDPEVPESDLDMKKIVCDPTNYWYEKIAGWKA